MVVVAGAAAGEWVVRSPGNWKRSMRTRVCVSMQIARCSCHISLSPRRFTGLLLLLLQLQKREKAREELELADCEITNENKLLLFIVLFPMMMAVCCALCCVYVMKANKPWGMPWNEHRRAIFEKRTQLH
jgi:hypothetical protein